MIYGSVCSGIESASIAWEPLGWQPAWFAEIEPFPSAVLAHSWPRVANMGDMCKLPALIDLGIISAPDVLVGGTPCQAFSVAGMRKGMGDDRGQLTIKYVEVANAIDRKRPAGKECIVVWENVPGVLSDKTNAFGCFLAALVGEDDPLESPGKKWSNSGIVYGPQRVAAWRVLDAQYFGVAQRRRRVFVVASARDGFDPAKVLFEFEGVRRDSPPSREAGKRTASSFTTGPQGADFTEVAATLDTRCRNGPVQNQIGTGVYSTSGAGYWREGVGALRGREQDSHDDIVACLDSSYGRLQGCPGQDLNHGHSLLVVHGTQDPCIGDKAFSLGGNGGQENAVAFTQNTRDEVRLINGDSKIAGCLSAEKGAKQQNYVAAFSAGQSKGAGSIAYQPEQSPTLRGGASGTNQVPTLHTGMQVRRLTPVECERLQGFSDNHTRIPWSKKPAEDCPDGHRYKAIGNSKAVPVIKWIGERIDDAVR